MKTNNEILLRSWLEKTFVDNPDLIDTKSNPVEMYAKLQEIWLREIQDAFKHIIKEYSKL